MMIMLFGDEYQYLVVVNRTYRVDNNDVVLSNGNIDNTEESTSIIKKVNTDDLLAIIHSFI